MNKVNFNELDFNYDTYLETYQSKPFTGIALEISANANLIAEVSFKDGIKDGPSKYWYPSGQIEKDFYFKNGVGHGHMKEWYENGQLKEESIIELGVILWRNLWDEKGQLIEEYKLKEEDQLYEILLIRRKNYS